MSTPRFETVYEHLCCPWHSNTCGLRDWCCDACPEAGCVPVTKEKHPKYLARVSRGRLVGLAPGEDR